jgi:hypothetical protein
MILKDFEPAGTENPSRSWKPDRPGVNMNSWRRDDEQILTAEVRDAATRA